MQWRRKGLLGIRLHRRVYDRESRKNYSKFHCCVASKLGSCRRFVFFPDSQDALLPTVVDRRRELRIVTFWALAREYEKVVGIFLQVFPTQLVKVWRRKTFAMIALHGRIRSIMDVFFTCYWRHGGNCRAWDRPRDEGKC